MDLESIQKIGSCMKKFKFKIQGNEYETEISEMGENNIMVKVNGTIYEVILENDLSNQNKPLLSQKSEKIVNVESTPARNTSVVNIVSNKESAVKAPLPGVIVDIHTKVGDRVSLGQKLITIEAMKMENSLNADSAGIVKQIMCAKGDNVKEGDVLMLIVDEL